MESLGGKLFSLERAGCRRALRAKKLFNRRGVTDFCQKVIANNFLPRNVPLRRFASGNLCVPSDSFKSARHYLESIVIALQTWYSFGFIVLGSTEDVVGMKMLPKYFDDSSKGVDTVSLSQNLLGKLEVSDKVFVEGLRRREELVSTATPHSKIPTNLSHFN